MFLLRLNGEIEDGTYALSQVSYSAIWMQIAMKVVIALGGNALLQRGEPMTLERQRQRVRLAMGEIAPLAAHHELLITHGNGPQIGALALAQLEFDPEACNPLDVLGAQTDGLIGYLIEQELAPLLPHGRGCATLLTRIEVDPADPAFQSPSKFIGPVYGDAEARSAGEQRNWQMARDGAGWRRVVASPAPQRIINVDVIRLLVSHSVVVICAGGGGIPVAARDDGAMYGVDAVIDKDHASALLAREVDASALMLLTDVEAIYDDWGGASARLIRTISCAELARRELPAGSMGPKAAAACEFVSTTGGVAAVGRLQDAAKLLDGLAGTRIIADNQATEWY